MSHLETHAEVLSLFVEKKYGEDLVIDHPADEFRDSTQQCVEVERRIDDVSYLQQQRIDPSRVGRLRSRIHSRGGPSYQPPTYSAPRQYWVVQPRFYHRTVSSFPQSIAGPSHGNYNLTPGIISNCERWAFYEIPRDPNYLAGTFDFQD